MKDKAIAVEFERLIDGRMRAVRVPLEEIAAYHAQHGGWVQKVWFQKPDGSEWWSWGKSWVWSDTGKIQRVGAGAYGDRTVWEGAA